MYFKRIELQGFKSFAEPITIEFQDGITCIVGPNGSGKSNISDAIRWVLGEQSPKMLRGGKMEEVIFAGTASRKSRGMAEVTLVVDNSRQILPIDYSEVAITRRMYRSGESEYMINKIPCRLRDVRELIMDTGIGVDGYSIIGQGKIADIVSNKPESRREIFEEAAGIVKYRTKKAEAERKMENSRNNLDRVNDIISEIEGRIHGLEQDSKKAEEYLTLRERYRDIEINITLKNLENIELKNEYIKDDLKELEGQIENYAAEKEAVDKEVWENRTKSEALGLKGNEIQGGLMKAAEELNSLIGQEQLNREKRSSIEKEQERLQSEIAGLEQKKIKEETNAQALRENKEKLDRELGKLKDDLEEKSRKTALLTAEAENAFKGAEAHKSKIYEFHSLMVSKNSEIGSLKGMGEALARRKKQVFSEKESSETTGGGLADSHKKKLNDWDTLRNQLAEVESAKIVKQKEQNRNLERERQLAQELEAVKLKAGQASARKKMIEEMENAYEGYNHGVKFVMRSGLPGLHGVVAELMEVPAGYETAIETALGGQMQNVICEDDKSARAAVAALKEKKAGRLTFLPLSDIRSAERIKDSRMEAASGYKGFAADRVSFDPKYRKVMEYLLGRVVIVEDLACAVALSKKNDRGLRFVTMDGELINAGGAITGGKFKNDTVGFLERKGELKKLTEKLVDLEATGRRMGEERGKLAKAIEDDKLEVQRLTTLHRELEMELLSAENEIRGLIARMEEVEAAKEKWGKELDSIDREEAGAAFAIEALAREAKAAEEQIALSERLAEEALTRYEGLKGELEEATEELTKARLLLGAAEGEKAGADQILERIETYLMELQSESQVKTTALEALTGDREGMIEDSGDIALKIEEKGKEKAALEETLRSIQDEKLLLGRLLTETEQKKESMEGILLGLQANKHELELKLVKNETQVEGYKEKLWEDFEISYVQAIEFRKKDLVMSAALKESRELKNRIRELGEVNVGAIKEYETVRERYDFLTEQRSDLLLAMDSLMGIIEDMDKTIHRSFSESFCKIAANFKDTFRALFGGGTAELQLEDEDKPLESGISIIAQPPGKKLQNINLMSGGEKTLTAIALMFAVLRAKPTPFCILDEVEAALDDVNIERVAQYLRDFKEVQFALITHQKATMEYADVLYGVTMPEQGISRVISLKLGDEFELQ